MQAPTAPPLLICTPPSFPPSAQVQSKDCMRAITNAAGSTSESPAAPHPRAAGATTTTATPTPGGAARSMTPNSRQRERERDQQPFQQQPQHQLTPRFGMAVQGMLTAAARTPAAATPAGDGVWFEVAWEVSSLPMAEW